MSVRYKDYYSILGLPRGADAAEIKRAFRDRAKAFHPDRSPGRPEHADRFREINEAYAVLGDPARRASYDGLGAGHREGEDLNGEAPEDASRPAGRGDFSEFFAFLTRRAGSKTAPVPAELETELEITLEEAVSGVSRNVTLAIRETGAFGRVKTEEKKLEIKVPAGIRDGQRLRIRSRNAGLGRGDDVYLRIRIAPHPRFSFEGDDLVNELRVTPWEAALGVTLRAPTLEGIARLRLPGGSTSGQRLRLKGQGFPLADGVRGDLVYRIMVSLPERLTAEERRLMEELASISDYDPRR